MSKKQLPKATHQADLDLNGFKLFSSVLEDGTGLFSERSLALAFGIKGGGAHWKRKKEAEISSAVLPEYLSAKYLQPFIPKELKDKLSSAVDYISVNGTQAKGVDVTVLSDICDVYITAQKELLKAGKEYPSLNQVAENAYTMIKAFSKVGIIALVYEATGYETVKAKDALQKFLEKFLLEEKGKWIKTYPDEFFEMIFRMKGLTWKTANKGKKPQWIGHHINDFVYSRIAPKVLKELREVNPAKPGGGRGAKHTQFITTDFGHPKLKEHIAALIALGKGSGYNWNNFKRFVERAFPKFREDGSAIQELDFPASNNFSYLFVLCTYYN